MIPTLASCSFDEIVDAAKPGQVQFMQLYVNKDREITRKIVEHAEKRGIKGLFITVDAPQLGRREKDMRQKFADEGSNVQRTSGDSVDKTQGAARAISSFIDPGLSWKVRTKFEVYSQAARVDLVRLCRTCLGSARSPRCRSF